MAMEYSFEWIENVEEFGEESSAAREEVVVVVEAVVGPENWIFGVSFSSAQLVAAP